MNHTKGTTLGIATAIVVGLAVIMVAAAATTPLVTTGHNAFAYSKGVNFIHKVKVGDTETKCIEAADNSQHAVFGAGSTGDNATNKPTNTQSQTCNSGSTGTG